VLQHPGRIFTPKELTHDYDISENTARNDLEKASPWRCCSRCKRAKAFCTLPGRTPKPTWKNRQALV